MSSVLGEFPGHGVLLSPPQKKKNTFRAQFRPPWTPLSSRTTLPLDTACSPRVSRIGCLGCLLVARRPSARNRPLARWWGASALLLAPGRPCV